MTTNNKNLPELKEYYWYRSIECCKNLQHIFFIFGFLVSFFLLEGCVGMDIDKEIELKEQKFSSEEENASKLIFNEYRLSPGDKIDVSFQFSNWGEKESFKLSTDNKISIKFVHLPELNETQRIQPNGKISLPYIGEVYVVGKTISELSSHLKKAYEKELVNPELYVTLDDFQAEIQEIKKDLYTPSGGLSRLVTVRPDGFCTFPIIGDIFVSNKTISEASNIVNKEYEKKDLGISTILFLEKHSEAKIFVAGEVKIPGAYEINKMITVAEAIALAEGYRQGADLDNAIVIRNIKGKLVAKKINAINLNFSNSGEASVFYIKPNDFIYVPQNNIYQLSTLITEIQNIILFRGWAVSMNIPISEIFLDNSSD